MGKNWWFRGTAIVGNLHNWATKHENAWSVIRWMQSKFICHLRISNAEASKACRCNAVGHQITNTLDGDRGTNFLRTLDFSRRAPSIGHEKQKKEATEARQEHVEQIDDHPPIGDLAQWTDDLLPANSTCYWELWSTTDMSNGKSGCFIQACGNGFHVGLNPVKSQLMSCYRIPQWATPEILINKLSIACGSEAK